MGPAHFDAIAKAAYRAGTGELRLFTFTFVDFLAIKQRHVVKVIKLIEPIHCFSLDNVIKLSSLEK